MDGIKSKIAVVRTRLTLPTSCCILIAAVLCSQVGIGAQLPSGGFSETNFDYKPFFDFLLKGGEAYETLPQDRFNLQ